MKLKCITRYAIALMLTFSLTGSSNAFWGRSANTSPMESEMLSGQVTQPAELGETQQEVAQIEEAEENPSRFSRFRAGAKRMGSSIASGSKRFAIKSAELAKAGALKAKEAAILSAKITKEKAMLAKVKWDASADARAALLDKAKAGAAATGRGIVSGAKWTGNKIGQGLSAVGNRMQGSNSKVVETPRGPELEIMTPQGEELVPLNEVAAAA